ncbi:hypothetical protein [Kitasatospora cathayae]|uniref:Uncharacterized protein n=1 Tax=Kitasatospora cathayae TaxID=3004092 RepID=A0ABY7QA11_9ACTN|nr:hypothetical protein [Kitasatospora sp. HUAS 3-15]WBP89593.1 hypothetical protein O1G21_29620 [Kitasatospora sp. HUAS 3-15]
MVKHEPTQGSARGPDRCDCGKLINGTVGEDGITTWVCECRRFGYLLPPDYQQAHPDESRVQVCGRRRPRVVAPVAA